MANLDTPFAVLRNLAAACSIAAALASASACSGAGGETHVFGDGGSEAEEHGGGSRGGSRGGSGGGGSGGSTEGTGASASGTDTGGGAGAAGPGGGGAGAAGGTDPNGGAGAGAGASGGGTGAGGAGQGTGGEPSAIPLPLPPSVHSHGDPSALEQALLEEVQRARANPAAEGKRIVGLPEVQGALDQFGVDPNDVVADFASYPPAPPLAFDAKLIAAARFHSEDMAKQGFQGHDGSAGESFGDRIAAAGYSFGFASENVFAHASSVAQCSAAFLIDWGNPNLGHRKTLLDLDARKRDVGMAIVLDPPHPAVGPLVVTQDFANPVADDGKRFVVGVAFTDANANGAYDVGEGLSGLRVVPEQGPAYAITGESGGFAVPLAKNAGQVRIQLQEVSSTVLAEGAAVMGIENVKLDFVLPQ